MSSTTTTPTPKTIFSVDGLGIGFGDWADVLSDVTLDVTEGEFISLLGPSGCGKTTILNLAAGLLSPRRGDVSFDGRAISGVNTAVGYMTQDDTLLPWRTVASNIGLPLKLRKTPKHEIGVAVDKYLELLDLTHAASLFPAQLSGGMRRRALLARSMIYEPTLLLMDEPFAALDAQMRHQMHIELRRAVKRLGQTVLFVTHDLNEAAILSDRVLVVGGGPPGHIVAEVEVPFGEGRDLESLPFDDSFLALERELHATLLSARKPRDNDLGGGA